MSDKDKKPGKSGAARPPVINVQAREVKASDKDRAAPKTSDAAKMKESSAGKAKQAEKPGSADKPGQGKSQNAPAGAPAGKAAKDGKDKGAAARNNAEKPAGKPNPTPAEHPERKKSRTGLKVLAGVLLLGAAAGGGAWLYHQYGPEKRLAAMEQRLAAAEGKLAAAGQARDIAAQVAALKKRVSGLETAQRELIARMEKLNASGANALASRVQTLEERVGALASLPEQLRANAERLAALEKTVEGLRGQMNALKEGLEQLAGTPTRTGGTTTVEGGSGAGAQGASAMAAVVALKLALKDTQQKLAALNQQVASLRQGADPARFEMLEARLKKLEEGLIRVRTELHEAIAKTREQALQAMKRADDSVAAVEELKKNPPVPKYVPPPQAVAYAALYRKAMAGEPFAAELEKLSTTLPGVPQLATLSPYAASGVPTREALAKRLRALVEKHKGAPKPAETAARTPSNDPLDVLRNKLMNVVKVRKAGEVDWTALVARAKAKLASEGLAAAVSVLAAHEAAAPAEVRQWLKDARARLKVDKALDALAREVLSKSAQPGK